MILELYISRAINYEHKNDIQNDKWYIVNHIL